MSDDRHEIGPALFSPDRVYRYTLTRQWNSDLPMLQVIGLNPSTADEKALDPTLRRVRGFATAWGMGGFVMTNLFAVRTKDPVLMKAHFDPVGPNNDYHLLEVAKFSALSLAAWGTHGGWLGRDAEVSKFLWQSGVRLTCLGTTKDGFPRHPLYVKGGTEPVPYEFA